MATVTFNYANGAVLTGTSGNDEITLNGVGAGAGNSVTLNGGLGTDTVVFDGQLAETPAANDFTAGAANGTFTIEAGATDDSVVTNGVEYFQFDNGTVSSNAVVTAELLLQSDLSQDTGFSWIVNNLFSYNGTAVTANNTWSLTSVDGSSLTSGKTLTLFDGSTVVGTVGYNGTNLTFTADNAYQASLDIGEEAEVSFDIVLTKDGVTFTETLTAVVTGTASDADNTYVASSTASSAVDLMGGDDRATGNAAADTIVAGDGDDSVYAGSADAAADHFTGGDGDDILAGGAGADFLVGDSIDTDAAIIADSGDAANDTGSNTLYGGAGADFIVIGGINANGVALAALTNANAVGAIGGAAYGGDDNDTIIGTASGNDTVGMGDGADSVMLGSGDNVVYAGADDTGNDTVTAGAGDNTIYTGAGADSVVTTGGDDLIGAGAGADSIAVGNGDNTVYGGDDNDTITAGTGADSLFGGAGNDSITAGDGADEIYGGAGNDTILGGDGNDTIDAGTGNDSLTGGNGNDTFVFTTDGGSNTITDFGTGTNVIDLTAFDTAFTDLVTSTVGGAITIYVDADTSITLTGVTSVDAGDFLF